MTHLLPGGGVLGFTGLGALSLPVFPISPLPGKCVTEQPRLQALTHYAAPLMRGRLGCRRRRVRATGLSPVGSHGLARRLPSRRAGANHCLLLLPWPVQCPCRVCLALAVRHRCIRAAVL